MAFHFKKFTQAFHFILHLFFPGQAMWQHRSHQAKICSALTFWSERRTPNLDAPHEGWSTIGFDLWTAPPNHLVVGEAWTGKFFSCAYQMLILVVRDECSAGNDLKLGKIHNEKVSCQIVLYVNVWQLFWISLGWKQTRNISNWPENFTSRQTTVQTEHKNGGTLCHQCAGVQCK